MGSLAACGDAGGALALLPRAALLPTRHAPPAPQRGWELAGGRITFKPAADKEAAAAAPPALEIISHCLNYAREVERIV